MKLKYVKCNPGGNITAIVRTSLARKDYVNVSKLIMETDSEIEQVGFIEEPTTFEDADSRLHMMGGEFCGNATRCLAWMQYQQGKGIDRGDKKIIRLEVSGTDKLLESEIDQDLLVEVAMPIKQEWESVKDIEISTSQSDNKVSATLVELDGIVHILISRNDAEVNTKEEAKEIMGNLNLLEREACGVISTWLSEDGSININPFIWVKETGTLIQETGCSSGSIALAQAEAKKRNTDVTLTVVQPSGTKILATVSVKDNRFLRGTIKGTVRIIGEYETEFKEVN